VRLYLDTNVFIAAFEATGPRHISARRLLEAVERGVLEAATSEMTLAELLVRPLRAKDRDLAESDRSMISPDAFFGVVAVDRRVLEGAALQRAERPSLKLPDAVHLASAIEAGCDAIASGDLRLPAPPQIPLLDFDAMAGILERPR